MEKSSFPKVGLGRAILRFVSEDSSKPCLIGGVIFDDVPGLEAESDGDVVFLSLCDAISSLSGVPILRGVAKDLCRKDGITDSEVYLKKAVETLGSHRIVHVALSLQGKRPYFEEKAPLMKEKISEILGISPSQVGITSIQGEGLSDVACGDGVECIALLTVHFSG